MRALPIQLHSEKLMKHLPIDKLMKHIPIDKLMKHLPIDKLNTWKPPSYGILLQIFHVHTCCYKVMNLKLALMCCSKKVRKSKIWCCMLFPAIWSSATCITEYHT